jgi:hypothetical protein
MMSSGPNAFQPTALPDDIRKQLLAVAHSHRPDRTTDECHECGRQYPCHTRLDAVHELLMAGVDPVEWR